MPIKEEGSWREVDICIKVYQKYLRLGDYIKNTEADKISVKEIEDFFKLDEKVGSGYCNIFKKDEEKEYVV